MFFVYYDGDDDNAKWTAERLVEKYINVLLMMIIISSIIIVNDDYYQ